MMCTHGVLMLYLELEIDRARACGCHAKLSNTQGVSRCIEMSGDTAAVIIRRICEGERKMYPVEEPGVCGQSQPPRPS